MAKSVWRAELFTMLERFLLRVDQDVPRVLDRSHVVWSSLQELRLDVAPEEVSVEGHVVDVKAQRTVSMFLAINCTWAWLLGNRILAAIM